MFAQVSVIKGTDKNDKPYCFIACQPQPGQLPPAADKDGVPFHWVMGRQIGTLIHWVTNNRLTVAATELSLADL